MRRISLALPALLLLAAAPAHASTLVRLDGVGPLSLGMARTDALGTGWLSNRGTGCKLGGKPYPITYRLKGAGAPAGIAGDAEFNHGKLTTLSFTGGVHTATGVVPGTTSASSMLTRYRKAGFVATKRYDSTFQGTFVTVMRHAGGATVMTGFADKGKPITQIGIPLIPLCE